MPPLRHAKTYSEVLSLRRMIVESLGLLFLLAGVALACFSFYLAIAVWLKLQDAPALSCLESYDRGEPVQVFDRYDHLILSFKSEQNRKRVGLSQISPAMRWATLAAEDHTFYLHHGVSVMAMGRALLANLLAGHVVEGGSTITQQLVKNLFFEQPKRTLERKIAEALIASELERRYSKDQILEMYLNEAYFGNGAYGIEQAARYYFGKSAADLGIPEAAFLAGLIKSPSRLGARGSRPAALHQQQETIEKMARYGFIAPVRAAMARQEPLRFFEGPQPGGQRKVSRYPYYISYVLDLVRQRYTPGEIRRQGLRIYTALDPTAQEAAERFLRQGIAGAPAGVEQGALVTVAVKDGSVIALVGGVDYQKSQYNCATHAHTAGSAFKPFVYLAAFEAQVMTPDSQVSDTPLTVKQNGAPDWRPKNFDGRFMGDMTASDALALSRNVCAVRVAQRVGLSAVVDVARRAGIRQEMGTNPALALGSCAVSPLEMAGAYATFARGGLAVYPWVLRRIDNSRGHVVETFDQPVSRAFGSEPVDQLCSALRRVVTAGTGQGANIADLYVAGKTGTADQARDLWFVGFTPDLVTAVWGGSNEDHPIAGAHVTGGTVMAGIWREYTRSLYDNQLLARNGLVRRGVAARAEVPRPQAAPAQHEPAPDAVSDAPAAPAAPAAPPPLKDRSGRPIILKMQQAKLDVRSAAAGDVKVRW